ncbi:MAG: SpoIIE family protein phosphatase [Bariatricus sp.]
MEENRNEAMVMQSPYVTQADKFAKSLRHLADTFLKMEETREGFDTQEVQDMISRVEDRVCASCERREHCTSQNREQTDLLIYDLLCTVEKYGTELNVEMKRKLQKSCIQAPRFLRTTLEVFQEAKKELMWNNKIVLNREGCAIQLDTFAQLIQHATRELDASIFQDPPLEKKLKMHLKRAGVRMLSSVFFVNPQGRYEIHVTGKTEKGVCMTTKRLSEILSDCVGRKMCPASEERPVLSQEYCTVICVEGPGYYTMQGIAKIGKGCQKISGDSFLMTRLPGGQEAAILSDGMGSGEQASRESAMIVDMLEELLKAGFPRQTALSMMNTALVMGREEVCFSTVDMSIFDLYSGECEFVKAGAAPTFIRKKERIEHIYSENLPLGVVQNQKSGEFRRNMESGDIVVMVTDGILDALPPGEQEKLLDLIIGGTPLENPKELAHYILQSVLELSDGEPKDDMTVLVAGIWEMCYSNDARGENRTKGKS